MNSSFHRQGAFRTPVCPYSIYSSYAFLSCLLLFYWMYCSFTFVLFHGIKIFILFCGHDNNTFWPFVPSLFWPMLILAPWWFHFSFYCVNSLIISIIMSLPFMLFMNCSFNLLYFCLYPHLFALFLRWPIHSSASLFYTFCTLLFRVCTILSPSQPNQLNIFRTLVLSCLSKLLVIKMFFTCMSKLHRSWYLSTTFQSNVGCLSAVLPDLGGVCADLPLWIRLYASLMAMMTVLVVAIAACINACIMLCSSAMFSYGFVESTFCESAWIFLFQSALCDTSCLLVLTTCSVTHIEGW